MFDFHFDIRSTDPDTDVTVSPIAAEDGIAQYRILVRLPKKAAPSPVRIEWEDEMRDILGVWRPSCGTDHAVRQWFSPTVSRSWLCSGISGRTGAPSPSRIRSRRWKCASGSRI